LADPSAFARLVEIMARLRGAGGCPWDREQTHSSLKSYLLEEAYEALEAIDQADDRQLCEELGDVLLQVLFHAQIASEEEHFGIEDVCRSLADKLVRRHPHIFAQEQADTSGQVLRNWERIKQAERQDQTLPPSLLDGLPPALPALLRAQRLQDRAARVGFDWDRISGPLAKVEEEFAELRQAWENGSAAAAAEEFGDLLFALVNVSRFLKLSPEDALRQAAGKFERRFRALEGIFREQGRDLHDSSLEEMDRVWDRVKAAEG